MVFTCFPAPKNLAFTTLRALLPNAATLAVLTLSAVPCSATVTNQFLRLTSYPTGGTPARIVAADFNHDGKADVVVLNSNGVLSFEAGTGAGTLNAPKTIATLPAATASALMASGDFNGDGNPDVVLLPPPGNAVQVFAGHDDGTFAAPVTFSDGLASAAAMGSGDFNNDGKPDIAVAGATSVSILLGNGSTILAKAAVTTTGLTVASGSLVIALGDVNRDSHLDVAVADQNWNFQILLGSSTGTLHAAAVAGFPSGGPAAPNVLGIGDFNGDGKPDMAAGTGAGLPYFFFPSVCFFDGNGDGTFASDPRTCVSMPINIFTEMLVTNLNGKPGFTFPYDPLFVFVNNGSEVFTQGTYGTGGPLALADFNGDSQQDIVSGSSAGVQVILNAGLGKMRAPLTLVEAAGNFTFSVAMNTADMNHDGYADLTLMDGFDEHGYLISSVGVLLGGPRNQFRYGGGAGLNDDLLSQPIPPAIGDFNHDGHLDVVASSFMDFFDTPPQAEVVFGDGTGNLPAGGPFLPMSPNYIAAGYFNAGGVEDLAAVDASGLSVMIGNGDGTFAPAKNYGVGNNPVFVLQRDLNGDGKRDLVVVNHDSDTISVLLGNGDGKFKPQVAYAAGTLPNTAVTGDFNRDGKVDIAVGSSTGISVLLGNGNGTFQAQKLYAGTGPITGIAQASVRQDGNECLLGIDSSTNRFVLLPGAGNGTFGAPVFYPADRVPVGIVAADFDRDGATDIALLAAYEGTDFNTAQPSGGFAEIFYNQGGDHVSLASSSTNPKASQAVTLTAHVAKSPYEAGSPGGTVTFKDGARFLRTVPLSAGSASISAAFAAGTHSIVAQYSGDANFNPNHSAPVTINAAP
jgi:hypothetical protein